MLMRILCTLVMASLAIGLTIGAATICYDIWAVASYYGWAKPGPMYAMAGIVWALAFGAMTIVAMIWVPKWRPDI
jgi:hypothetical protein